MATETMKGPVLLVDDNADLVQTLDKLFEGAGILAIPFSDPARAIDEIRRGLSYRLAIIDASFGMSRYTGAEVCGESKRAHPEVPVLVLSGHVDPEYRRAMRWGDGFIQKPINPSTLIGIVRRYVG